MYSLPTWRGWKLSCLRSFTRRRIRSSKWLLMLLISGLLLLPRWQPPKRRQARSWFDEALGQGQRLHIKFCNVSSWSELAKSELAHAVGNFDVYLLAEHHQSPAKLMAAKKDCSSL
eukprot:5948624-Pyramimonas_sp.AAC.1